mmetsp:Transcript_31039/g.60927  ORF Transcript_31039/g.60927 Transcript_31039/m.60927 type:complete len:87 (-) Transcript_31039:868-1128(-)
MLTSESDIIDEHAEACAVIKASSGLACEHRNRPNVSLPFCGDKSGWPGDLTEMAGCDGPADRTCGDEFADDAFADVVSFSTKYVSC